MNQKTENSLQQRLVALQANMLNFAYMLTSDRDDAYDLLQDTTLKVLDNANKFVDNVNFKGWVLTIMRNIFINNYRRASRSRVVIDKTDDLIHLNVSQDSGLETPDGALAAHEISGVIDSFPDEFKIPFSMHVAGYKYVEIAEHTGLPLGTVKSRIYFARQKLMKSLADYRS